MPGLQNFVASAIRQNLGGKGKQGNDPTTMVVENSHPIESDVIFLFFLTIVGTVQEVSFSKGVQNGAFMGV